MVAIDFNKMHGLGNDFIIVSKDQIATINNPVDLIRQASARHTGIGCDQFIIYDVIAPDLCEMFIYNSDGSIAEACGNGTRCLVSLIYEKYAISNLNIKTKNRVIKSLIIDGDISVNMGQASFDEVWMPDRSDLLEILNLFNISGKEVQCVDIGNPHLVIFSKNIAENDRKTLIDKIYSSNLFKDGVNINFARIEDNQIDLYVWERGVGHTFACGSGACASFAAANKLGFIQNHVYVNFQLGSLKLKFDHNDIIMTGSATKIISGRYFYEGK